MPIKIFLHIGSEKTGTTTIQRTLATNRQKLQENHVLFPRSLGETNHFDLSVHCLDDDRLTPLRQLRSLVNSEQINQERNQIENRFIAEVKAIKPKIIILSSEQLSSNVWKVSEVERLKIFLNKISSDIKVLCYLRRQDEMALSSYSTQVKAGQTSEFNPKVINFDKPKFNFKVLLELWTSVFPKNMIDVRIFDNRFLDTDIITDFKKAVSISNIEISSIPTQNQSLDKLNLEILRRMNEYLPKHGNSQGSRGNLQEILTSLSNKEKLQISNDDSKYIMDRLKNSNQWILNQFFSSLSYNPFEEKRPIQTDGNSSTADSIEIDDIIRIFSKVWLKKQKQFEALKNRMKNDINHSD